MADVAGEAMDISLTEDAFYVLNGPICPLSLLAYIFYAFCLFCHQDGQGPKQPLKILLGTLVTFMGLLQMSNFFFVINVSCPIPWDIVAAVTFMQFYFFLCTLATAVWLNVFYYTQIVPPHNAFSIRLKKSIKYIVYCAIISDKVLFLVDIAMYAVPVFADSSTSPNATSLWDTLRLPRKVFFYSRLVYMILGLIVMTAASGATVTYLRRHLKSMKESQSPFTSSLRSQARVAITGIVQIVLYFLCSAWFLLAHLLANVYTGPFDNNNYILISVFSLYCFGTAVNLGFGQSVFRRRTSSLFHKISEFLNLERL